MKKTKPTQAVIEKKQPAINRHLALVLYILLAIVAAALFVMTILASAGVQGVWNGMPTVAVLSLLGVALSVSVVAFNPRKSVYSIGFYLSHIGIVLFLVGSLVYAVSGEVTNAAPPNLNSITPTVEYGMRQQGITDRDIQNLKGYYNQVGNLTEAVRSLILALTSVSWISKPSCTTTDSRNITRQPLSF